MKKMVLLFCFGIILLSGFVVAQNCTDSDVTSEYPIGQNPYIKGTCAEYTGSYTDFCTGDILTEYFCEPGGGPDCDPTEIECSNGCENGACIQPSFFQKIGNWFKCLFSKSC